MTPPARRDPWGGRKPTKREVARRCAPLFAAIQRRLDEEEKAERAAKRGDGRRQV